MSTLPRGIRNNNPGNLRRGTQWEGLILTPTDKDFCQFRDPLYGLRALMKVLLAYQHTHGLKTVAAIIDRWAPPQENDTSAYAAAVARRLGVDPTAPIDAAARLCDLAKAIIHHENGQPPASQPPDWYPDTTYERARDMALGVDDA